MKKTRSIYIGWLLIGLLLSAGCYSKPRNNAQYLHHVAGIILQYQGQEGHLPASINAAVSALGIRLRNRGDVNGTPLVYINFGQSYFMLRSYGANLKNDLGDDDDFDVYYIRGKEVSRKVFVAALQADPNEAYREICHDWFAPLTP